MPPCAGSNPAAPASRSHFSRDIAECSTRLGDRPSLSAASYLLVIDRPRRYVPPAFTDGALDRGPETSSAECDGRGRRGALFYRFLIRLSISRRRTASPVSDDLGRPRPPGFFIGRMLCADEQGAGIMTRTTLTIARTELRAAPRADRAWRFAN